jgi:hypothetical protein
VTQWPKLTILQMIRQIPQTPRPNVALKICEKFGKTFIRNVPGIEIFDFGLIDMDVKKTFEEKLQFITGLAIGMWSSSGTNFT